MTVYRDAFLEAALMCSQYADEWPAQTVGRRVARELAVRLEAQADSPTHFYPPGKPVIDLGQVSENSSPMISGACLHEWMKQAVFSK